MCPPLWIDLVANQHRPTYLLIRKPTIMTSSQSIESLAVKAFLQSRSIFPSLCSYEDRLLSDQAKVTDRTLFSTEANDELYEVIGKFLALLRPHLMEALAVVECLVRRFRLVDRFISLLKNLLIHLLVSTHSISRPHCLSFFPTTSLHTLPKCSPFFISTMFSDSELYN